MKPLGLRFPATCTDCGAPLPAGTRANYAGPRRVYCLTHEGATSSTSAPAARPTGKLVWWEGKQVRGTRCEDAPCCGCC